MVLLPDKQGWPPVTTVATPMLANASTVIAQVEPHCPSVSYQCEILVSNLFQTPWFN